MPSRPEPSEAAGGEPHECSVDAPFRVEWTHHLVFTRDALSPENPRLLEALADTDHGSEDRGLVAVVYDGVTRTNPDLVDRLRRRFEVGTGLPELRAVLEVEGGEGGKNGSHVVDAVLESIDSHRICRKSTVLVIGGGAVLDAAGYAAAIAHRGVRLVRMPSTVLAQCDSGVGVKNGINRFGKKNFIGSFAPPAAVVCDTDLLGTLSDRDWICGFSEVVKIGMLKDRDLFECMERDADRVRARDESPAHEFIARSAELHLRHITDGGDPFELREARPLDFGHWAAHRLEQMTGFELRHGEAVAIGIALDTVYAELAGIAEPGLADRTLRLIGELGLPVAHPAMSRTTELLAGLQEFREHLGGRLTITLVERPGRPIDVHEMDPELVESSISRLLEEAGHRTPDRA